VRLSSSRPLLLAAAAAAAAAVFCSSRRAHKLNAQTSFASHLEDKLKKGGQQQQQHSRGSGEKGWWVVAFAYNSALGYIINSAKRRRSNFLCGSQGKGEGGGAGNGVR